jgi:hypothetical protein
MNEEAKSSSETLKLPSSAASIRRATYAITYEPSRALVRVAIKGFWKLTDVDSYRDELMPIVQRCRTEAGRCRVLIDRNASTVQSKDVADAMSAAFKLGFAAEDSVAMATTSALMRMQFNRTMARKNAKCFESMNEAEAWLLAL